MPPMMTAYVPMEVVVLPQITYIMIDHIHDTHRRIYTDGRDGRPRSSRAIAGYSIGRWLDEDTTAASTLSRSRPAQSRGRAPSSVEPAALTATTRRW